MKPWDIYTNGSKRPDDAFIIPLWDQFVPKDFSFAIIPSDYKNNINIVYIVPTEYFDKEHCLYIDSMPIVNILPPYLEEIFEGAYEAHNASREKIKQDMKAIGFVWSYFLEIFLEKNNF